MMGAIISCPRTVSCQAGAIGPTGFKVSSGEDLGDLGVWVGEPTIISLRKRRIVSVATGLTRGHPTLCRVWQQCS